MYLWAKHVPSDVCLNTRVYFQLKDSEIVKQGDATTKGRSEFVEEIFVWKAHTW